jgi:peptidoglycan/LPS O-acetylase OafA/YrhL
MSSTSEAAPQAGAAAGLSRAPAGGAARGRRPDIQGLRAIAVSLVVVYHLCPSALPGGFAGVDVFFVISGFLITGHLWRSCEEAGRVSLADFWGRRVRRLIPAATLVLSVTWGMSYLLLPASRLGDTARQIGASALYAQNWLLAGDAVNYLKSADAPSPAQHFWSLSVEEQFYLVWPLLFIAALAITRRGAGGRRHRAPPLRPVAAVLTAAVAVASLVYSVVDTAAGPAAAYFVTTTRIWELGAGGLLALLPAAAAGRLARHGWLGWAGLALLAASQLVLRASTAFPGWIALVPAGGAVALLAGGSATGRGGPWRLTSARPVAFVGDISYSLYLWHWPLIALCAAWRGHPPGLLSGPVLMLASVALAWLTKVTVEDRVRLVPVIARHRWRSLSVALAAAIPVTLAAAFLATQPGPWDGRLGPGYPGAAALADKTVAGKPAGLPQRRVLPPPAGQLTLPGYWADGCLDGQHVPTPKACVFGDTSHPTLTVALVGDSMAGNWWAPLDQIARQEHWRLVTELHAICPWTAAQLLDPDIHTAFPACHTWGARVLADLITKIRPNVVITTGLANMATVARPTPSSRARAEVGAGMAVYWRQLQAHRIKVVAIRETPETAKDEPGCVTKHGPASPSCATPPARAEQPDPPTSYAARAVDGAVPVINMNTLICAPDNCPPVVGNVLVYLDSHHLTQAYAQTLAPFLKARLTAALARG